MRAVTYSRGTNYEKIYHLNEEQATLLLTYLKNTPQVRAFKKELFRQFYAMRRDRWGMLPDMTFAQWENHKRGEGYLQK